MNRNEVPAVYGTGAAGPAEALELGRAPVVRPGCDLTIGATGVMACAPWQPPSSWPARACSAG